VQEERDQFGFGLSNGGGVRGPTGVMYEAPAYPVILPNSNYTQALEILDILDRARYFDLQTKVLRVDIAFYNAHLNRFHSVALVFEANRGGGLEKAYKHRTATLYWVLESKTWYTVAAEVIVAVFFLWFIVEETYCFWTQGMAHLNTETVMHLSNILCYVVVWIYRLISTTQ